MFKFECDMSQLDEQSIARLEAALNVAGNARFDVALERAGERLAEYLRGALTQKGLRDTRQLIDSIKPTKVTTGNLGDKHIDVYPHGTRKKDGRKKAIRNAEVGFAHEYGVNRKNPKQSIKASHWMSNTLDDVGEDILDFMEMEVNKIIDESIGG